MNDSLYPQSAAQNSIPSGLVGSAKQIEIPQELSGMETNLSILSETLSKLEDRLYPILQETNEKEGFGTPSQNIPVTSVGLQLRSSNEAILYQVRRINSIINRLHI